MFVTWFILSMAYLLMMAPIAPRMERRPLVASLIYFVIIGAGPAALFVVLFWSNT